MNYVHIVAVLAVLQFFLFGILVGRARRRYGVRAPATSGNEQFERAFRVLEIRWPRLVAGLPAYAVGSLGAFWTIQRLVALAGAR